MLVIYFRCFKFVKDGEDTGKLVVGEISPDQEKIDVIELHLIVEDVNTVEPYEKTGTGNNDRLHWSTEKIKFV